MLGLKLGDRVKMSRKGIEYGLAAYGRRKIDQQLGTVTRSPNGTHKWTVYVLRDGVKRACSYHHQFWSRIK